MVPKIHAKGKSFKGAAAYLLHDKDRAQSSERVEWTETLNLATDNPHSAWKVMAATAMMQDQLKERAGIAKHGRKSSDSVLHLTLSWHPEEKTKITRDEMMRSTLGALTALGAGDRQALVICHGDEKQPHVHILVNRVSQVDGRMLSSSNEKLVLSKWAERYEKERGQVYCDQRVLNNDARRRNKYTRGEKDQARKIYEAQEATRPSEQAKVEQRAKDAVLAKQAREAKERRQKQWKDLQDGHKQRIKDIKADAVKKGVKEKEAIRERSRPSFQLLFHEHQARLAEFVRNEKSTLGRIANAFRAIDFKAIVRGEDTGPDGRTRRKALDEAFNALSSAGIRKQALERRYEKEKRNLEKRENQAEKEAAKLIRDERDRKISEARIAYEKARGDLMLTQGLEGARFRAGWKTRSAEREKAWATGERTGQSTGRDHVPKNEVQLNKAKQLAESFRRLQRSVGRQHERDRERQD